MLRQAHLNSTYKNMTKKYCSSTSMEFIFAYYLFYINTNESYIINFIYHISNVTLSIMKDIEMVFIADFIDSTD